jgi:hypothetical protein
MAIIRHMTLEVPNKALFQNSAAKGMLAKQA